MDDILEECSRYWPDATRKSIHQEMVGPNEIILHMADGSQWCYDSIDKSIRRLRLDDPKDYILNEDDADARWCKEFGERMRILMHSRGITQDELAMMVDISQTTLSKYVRGKSIPGVPNALRIARALRCDLNELIDF